MSGLVLTPMRCVYDDYYINFLIYGGSEASRFLSSACCHLFALLYNFILLAPPTDDLDAGGGENSLGVCVILIPGG